VNRGYNGLGTFANPTDCVGSVLCQATESMRILLRDVSHPPFHFAPNSGSLNPSAWLGWFALEDLCRMKSARLRGMMKLESFRLFAVSSAICNSFLRPFVCSTLVRCEENFARPVSNGVFKQLRPIVSSAQTKHVCPDFVACACQPRSKPYSERIVFGIGVSNEDYVAISYIHNLLTPLRWLEPFAQ